MTLAVFMGGTRGLGLKLAEEAVARGYEAIVSGRTARDANTNGIPAVRLDFTDPDDPLGELRAIIAEKRPRYLFWVGGVFLKKRLGDCSSRDIALLVAAHLTGPIRALAEIQAMRPPSPYHLAVIGSTSSYAIRPDETVYCTMKAAKAAFARNFSRELARERPGSKTTLVNPGAMNTGFFEGTEFHEARSRLMDPAAVARIIWDRLAAQTAPYDEFNIENGADDWSVPVVINGIRPPESPF